MKPDRNKQHSAEAAINNLRTLLLMRSRPAHEFNSAAIFAISISLSRQSHKSLRIPPDYLLSDAKGTEARDERVSREYGTARKTSASAPSPKSSRQGPPQRS